MRVVLDANPRDACRLVLANHARHIDRIAEAIIDIGHHRKIRGLVDVGGCRKVLGHRDEPDIG